MRYVYIGLAVVAVLILITAITLWATGSDDQLSGIWPEQKLGPKAAKAKAAVADQRDLQQAAEILDGGFAAPVNCARAAQSAFDPATGNPRYWQYTWPSGIIECFAGPGFHRVTGKELKPLGEKEIAVIIDPKNCELYPLTGGSTLWAPPAKPAAHRPAPQPPAPVATPLPELGQGPCCPNR